MTAGRDISLWLLAAMPAAILKAAGLLPLWYGKQQKQKRMRKMLHRLSVLGSENDLSFSSQEVLTDSVIGLDGINRRLIALTQVSMHRFHKIAVYLNEVKRCTVKKVYGAIRTGDLRKGRLEQHLKKIVLQFELDNESQVEIPFYNQSHNALHQIPEMERKAKRWQAMLSKLLKTPAAKNVETTSPE